jgi:hypothetical protein
MATVESKKVCCRRNPGVLTTNATILHGTGFTVASTSQNKVR